jgi:hypothetical protein
VRVDKIEQQTADRRVQRVNQTQQNIEEKVGSSSGDTKQKADTRTEKTEQTERKMRSTEKETVRKHEAESRHTKQTKQTGEKEQMRADRPKSKG